MKHYHLGKSIFFNKNAFWSKQIFVRRFQFNATLLLIRTDFICSKPEDLMLFLFLTMENSSCFSIATCIFL